MDPSSAFWRIEIGSIGPFAFAGALSMFERGWDRCLLHPLLLSGAPVSSENPTEGIVRDDGQYGE